MSDDTQSRHCLWLMLVLSLAHSISGDAKAGHSRTVLSQLPDAIRVPSGLNATLDTTPVCPVSGSPRGWPVSAFHSWTVPSALPLASRCPSGLYATLDTRSVWPVSGVPMSWSVSTSHSRTEPSALPL